MWELIVCTLWSLFEAGDSEGIQKSPLEDRDNEYEPTIYTLKIHHYSPVLSCVYLADYSLEGGLHKDIQSNRWQQFSFFPKYSLLCTSICTQINTCAFIATFTLK
jgi:hypothetical protein